MVKKMNKEALIELLAEELGYPVEKCILINDVLENHFFLSKKNEETIIDELMQQLEVDHEEANRIYEAAIKIIKEEVKNKLKHPFQNQD